MRLPTESALLDGIGGTKRIDEAEGAKHQHPDGITSNITCVAGSIERSAKADRRGNPEEGGLHSEDGGPLVHATNATPAGEVRAKNRVHRDLLHELFEAELATRRALEVVRCATRETRTAAMKALEAACQNEVVRRYALERFRAEEERNGR